MVCDSRTTNRPLDENQLNQLIRQVESTPTYVPFSPFQMCDFLDIPYGERFNFKHACIYARFSSEMQSPLSTIGQFRECMKYAFENNIIITALYKDEAISGVSEVKRNAYQKMLSDIDAFESEPDMKIDLVILYKSDRQARQLTSAVGFEEFLKARNKWIYSVTEPSLYGDDANTELIRHINYSLNSYYSRNLSSLIKRGHRERMLSSIREKGIAPAPGGISLYGYDTVDGYPVINEFEAIAVKKIFEMASQGQSYSDILIWLRDSGYVNKKKKNFSLSSLHDLLRNPKYAGTVYYGGRAHRKSNKHRINVTEDTLVFEDAWPAIVSKAVFGMVQERLNKRMNSSVNKGTEYLLSGKIVCGCCGSSYAGQRHTSKTERFGVREYFNYNCRNRYRRSSNNLDLYNCSNKGIVKEALENQAIKIIKQTILNPANINKIVEYINGSSEEDRSKIKDEISAYEKEIGRLDDSINTALDRMLDSNLSNIVKDKLNLKITELEQSKSKVILHMEECEQKLHKEQIKPQTSVEQVSYIIDKCLSESSNSALFVKYIISMFVKEVVIYPNDILFKLDLAPMISFKGNCVKSVKKSRSSREFLNFKRIQLEKEYQQYLNHEGGEKDE